LLEGKANARAFGEKQTHEGCKIAGWSFKLVPRGRVYSTCRQTFETS
jgi:hypothetical protein